MHVVEIHPNGKQGPILSCIVNNMRVDGWTSSQGISSYIIDENVTVSTTERLYNLI